MGARAVASPFPAAIGALFSQYRAVQCGHQFSVTTLKVNTNRITAEYGRTVRNFFSSENQRTSFCLKALPHLEVMFVGAEVL